MGDKVAFFDIDGTLVTGQTFNTFVQHPYINRLHYRLTYLSLIPLYGGYKAGLVKRRMFNTVWVERMVRLMTGWSKEKMRVACDWLINEALVGKYRDDVIEHLRRHQRDGYRVVLVSGMFDGAVKMLVERLGADAGFGTRMIEDGDIYTGNVDGGMVSGGVKLDLIHKYLRENDLSQDLSKCYAYADSYSDMPMLSAVGHPVVTYPDDALREEAKLRGWTILPA